MLFNVRWYDDLTGKEIIKEVNKHHEAVARDMQRLFDDDDRIAIYQQVELADGRFCYTLKDRHKKIVIQYKQILK